jgi:hypothetical protein
MEKRVSLFVNCFERDYRQVLAPGFMRAKASQFKFPFNRVVVTLNNILDPEDARARARKALHLGEVHEFVEVEKMLPEALKVSGLKISDLGLVKHYLDFALVAATHALPDYLLYCCAEVDLVTPFDWVSEAVRKLEADRSLLVANPSWASDPAGAERESFRRDGDHWVGSGFSDQCFLADSTRLAAPIYKYKHEAGNRYPMSDIGDIFEKRVDAYMRHHGLMRISDARVFYAHAGVEGRGYPRPPLALRILRRGARLLRMTGRRIGTATTQPRVEEPVEGPVKGGRR